MKTALPSLIQLRSIFLSSLVVFAIASCGGGGGSSDTETNMTDTGSNEPVLLTGVFIDSPVAGVSFTTETQSGVTNSAGEFSYLQGENVQFSIGLLVFPSVPAASQISPVDMASGSSDSTTTTTNIARLLQSLDDDGNPDNGIVIPDATVASAIELNFDVSEEEFENNSDVINVVANSGSATSTLISAEAANEHLESQVGQFTTNDSMESTADSERRRTGPVVLSYSSSDEPTLMNTEDRAPFLEPNPNNLNEIRFDEATLVSCDTNGLNLSFIRFVGLGPESGKISLPNGGCLSLDETGIASEIQDTSDWPSGLTDIEKYKLTYLTFNATNELPVLSENCGLQHPDQEINLDFYFIQCEGWEFEVISSGVIRRLDFVFHHDARLTVEVEVEGVEEVRVISSFLQRKYEASFCGFDCSGIEIFPLEN